MISSINLLLVEMFILCNLFTAVSRMFVSYRHSKRRKDELTNFTNERESSHVIDHCDEE